ncbi:unnamed protein product [Leptidea sinapis]|uniref:Ferritin-like diiron domain-containing protein n=1 Tax=Leptidea sinapis TaxID=189913 RepID=A0A5E4PP04_9NEOP|nr:unnamed protein product [Leptidea sinapis]
MLTLPSCNAIYGHFSRKGNVAIELQAYANLHLRRSYEYLLSAAYYNNYQTNRLGFSKLFQKLSDDTWDKTIELIKHITKRGKKANSKLECYYNKGEFYNPSYTDQWNYGLRPPQHQGSQPEQHHRTARVGVSSSCPGHPEGDRRESVPDPPGSYQEQSRDTRS